MLSDKGVQPWANHCYGGCLCLCLPLLNAVRRNRVSWEFRTQTNKQTKELLIWQKDWFWFCKSWDCLLLCRLVEGGEPRKESVGTPPAFPRSRIHGSLLKGWVHPQPHPIPPTQLEESDPLASMKSFFPTLQGPGKSPGSFCRWCRTDRAQEGHVGIRVQGPIEHLHLWLVHLGQVPSSLSTPC